MPDPELKLIRDAYPTNSDPLVENHKAWVEQFVTVAQEEQIAPSLQFSSTDKAWVDLKTVPYGFLEGREHYSVEMACLADEGWEYN